MSNDFICFVGSSIPDFTQRCKNSFFLKNNSWDDYSYRTTYELYFIGEDKSYQIIGHVKVAKKGLTEGERPLQNGKLEALDGNYFSLGQDKEFYTNLRSLSTNYGSLFLSSLNDISFNYKLWVENYSESALIISLMRDVTALDVVSFNLVFNGKNDKLSYTVKFTYDNEEIDFSVNHNDNIYRNSNIHSLIGNNGVGKTTILKELVNKIAHNDFTCHLCIPELSDVLNQELEIPYIDRVIYASFSAFDNNLPSIPKGYKYDYLGLHNDSGSFKGPADLRDEFKSAFEKLIERSDQKYLSEVFEPLCKVEYLYEHVNNIQTNFSNIDEIISIYNELSSGHRIVIHTLVLLMNKLRQGMITLFDEPETHLHPPLLGAFLQSLQVICNTHNGMIIFATHSPIILQEILSSNVYVLRRVDNEAIFDRPHITTYGQNVSKLTRTAFGYQKVGFHKTISDLVASEDITKENIDEIDTIGSEARKLAWTQLYRNEDDK
ncbi:AAA family ATPase [Vibrio tasmaniensis]|uniref:AAA family ATPase n=1 Tax=Vibrio tasmaniensis TaxID=212663 RepID=UPI0011184C0D|nr:AAA family ATPase [Vibrio tasmaniensis]